MANVDLDHKYRLNSASDSITVNNGADGLFICDPSNPFDAAALAAAHPKKVYKVGHAFKLISKTAVNPNIATITTNGVQGAALEGEWPNGHGVAGAEVTAMTMTSGYAFIILKQVNEQG